MTKVLISCVTKHPDCRQKTKFKRQQSDAWNAICGEITDAYPQIKNVKQVKDRWQNLQKRFKLNVDSKNPNAKEATGRGRHKAPSNIEKSANKGKRPQSRSSEKKGKRPKTTTSESIAFVSDDDCTVSDEEDDDLADILGVASGVSDPSSTRVLNASRRKIIETREAIKPFVPHAHEVLRTSCT
ncbi:hypothetical protein CYMTET_48442 [Cymbomonas tetramitiformis]|uniref:Regulatory protein zeste n=1 Tax=Cymbomonas tetramitiformis TaxID=36881 RepID=A0AAE0EWS6_9CHLO|nr:hypothetical protein CYMTET_48442 [Cymbomonas tetramitiformis]